MLTLSKINDNEYVWWDAKILHTGKKMSTIAYGYWAHGIEKETIVYVMGFLDIGYKIEFPDNKNFTPIKISLT